MKDPRRGRGPDDDPTQQIEWVRDRRRGETEPLPLVGPDEPRAGEPRGGEDVPRHRTGPRRWTLLAVAAIVAALAVVGGLAAAGVAPVAALFGAANTAVQRPSGASGSATAPPSTSPSGSTSPTSTSPSSTSPSGESPSDSTSSDGGGRNKAPNNGGPSGAPAGHGPPGPKPGRRPTPAGRPPAGTASVSEDGGPGGSAPRPPQPPGGEAPSAPGPAGGAS